MQKVKIFIVSDCNGRTLYHPQPHVQGYLEVVDLSRLTARSQSTSGGVAVGIHREGGAERAVVTGDLGLCCRALGADA